MRGAVLNIVLGGIDPDARAWAIATGAVGAQVLLVSKLIRALKSAGVWTLLDRLWLFAAENATQALTDLVARSVATAVNSPTFTASQGYAGNGTTSYVSTGFIPSTHGVNYTLNSGSLFTYTNTTRAAADSMVIMGANNGTAVEAAMTLRLAAGTATGNINNTFAAGNASGAVTDTLGLQVASRTASNLTTLYRRTTALGTTSVASNAVPTNALFAGAYNSGGAAAAFETVRMAAVGAAAGLSAAQVAALNAALEGGYLTSIGANA